MASTLVRALFSSSCGALASCRDASAAVASGSSISKGSLVGRGSTVAAGARLERSVVGSECRIGRGAALQGSCLHAHVRVDDSCMVSSALVGEQAVVRSHAKVEVSDCHLVAAACTLLDTHVALFCIVSLPLRSCSLLNTPQTGALLGRSTVVDTAHCVPAGVRVSLMQRRASTDAGSEDEVEWSDPGAPGSLSCQLACRAVLA